MNIRDIKYIVTVADAGNFTRAAELCSVSQPTLSTQVHKVEKLLNCRIFDRKGTGITCTALGRELVNRARLILKEVEAMYDLARAKDDSIEQELRLGVCPTLAPYYMPRIISLLHEHYPNLTLSFSEEKYQILMSMLKQGQIDASLLSLPVTGDSINIHPLFTEPFMLCAHQEHPLSRKQAISCSDLKNQDILLLEKGHCIREQFTSICNMEFQEKPRDFAATSLETLQEMVASKLGIALVPAVTIRKRDDLAYIPFVGAIPARTVAMVSNNSSTKLSLVKELAHSLESLATIAA